MLRYGRDLASRVEAYDILGSPEDCIKRMEKFAEAGLQHFILQVHPPPGKLRENLQQIAKWRKPHFK
jgi:alkanesulfonate monooxygenase SsuD/methylene tetrahydromethanopterin reductase-like flavin-dependent oxidoreductase (luciferase family)